MITSMLAAVGSLLLPGSSLRGQAIQGEVRDAESLQGIGDVVIQVLLEDEVAASTTTDASGLFSVFLRRAGTYRLRAVRLGYRSAESDVLDVRARELVEVVLSMTSSPIPIEGIRVEGRRVDPRVEPTYEGLYARRQATSLLGGERVLLRSDPQMGNLAKVADVLRWFPRLRGCVFYYVDGRPVDLKYWTADDFFMNYPVAHLEGVEYYREDYMLPVGFPPPMRETLDARTCSVVVIWTRRPGM